MQLTQKNGADCVQPAWRWSYLYSTKMVRFCFEVCLAWQMFLMNRTTSSNLEEDMMLLDILKKKIHTPMFLGHGSLRVMVGWLFKYQQFHQYYKTVCPINPHLHSTNKIVSTPLSIREIFCGDIFVRNKVYCTRTGCQFLRIEAGFMKNKSCTRQPSTTRRISTALILWTNFGFIEWWIVLPALQASCVHSQNMFLAKSLMVSDKNGRKSPYIKGKNSHHFPIFLC